MKNAIILSLLLLLPTVLLAATYSGTVTRETSNLYLLTPQGKYIKTVNCTENAFDVDANLILDDSSGELSFTISGVTCTVEGVFDPLTFTSPLSNTRINVSSDVENWYSLNTYDPQTLIVTVEDNGKRVKTTNCSENVDQEFAYLTTNTAGIGSLDFGGSTYCNVSGVFDHTFEATNTDEIWVVHSIDTSGTIDWLATEHEILAYASYLRINGQYFYVYNSGADSPLPGGGADYNYTDLLACNQLTGEPGPGPYDPNGSQWADLTGLIDENIEVFSSWQDISDLEINIDLRQGWNLISVPLNTLWYVTTPPAIDLQDNLTNIPILDLSDLLSSIAGQYELVRGFDEEGEKSYDPSLPNDQNSLNYFSGGHGYWIKMNSPGTLTLVGRAPPATDSLQLHTGWNLVGHWGGDEKEVATSEGTSTYVADTPIGESLLPIIDSIELVRGFDEEGAKTYDPAIPENLNTLHTLKAGQGYWIKLNQDVILNFGQ